MGKIIDLAGKRFGRLVVVALHPKRSGRHAMWFCRCDCGTESIVSGYRLRSGETTSCRCFARERNTKHGLSRTRSYRVWLCMKQRCFNRRHDSYPNYGGRGKTICERWLSVVNFYADMGERPLGMSLDRIDPDGNYEPSNCRWATPLMQTHNRRPRRRSKRRVIARHTELVTYEKAAATKHEAAS